MLGLIAEGMLTGGGGSVWTGLVRAEIVETVAVDISGAVFR